jgi:hypothetical protein
LYRFLRALAAAGLVTHEAQQRFVLTARGAALRSDAPGQLCAEARVRLIESKGWGNLQMSVQTGKSAFRETLGSTYWEYREKHPEFAAAFNTLMTQQTDRQQALIVALYDFSRFHTVVDVGGGHGQLLSAILRANPGTHGILFDLPEVVEGAQGVLGQSDIRGRCTIAGGSFFDTVPMGGDAYVMKQTVHDWDDESARTILRVVRQAMESSGTLLLMERVLPEDRTLSLAEAIGDLNMLTCLDGKERTVSDFAVLFDATGFRLERVVPVDSNMSIIEGKCA